MRVTGVSLRVALISWWKGLRRSGVCLEKAAQQILLLCKGERQAISGQELTLVATSGFLGGTAGHMGEAELP